MNKKLQDLRKKIDSTDDKILLLLRERIDLMGKIGKVKRESKLPLRDEGREREKLNIIEEKAKKLGLPDQLITQIWVFIFMYSEEIER